MTRKEAIEILRHLPINTERQPGKHLIQKAMNMAIEALERKRGEWHEYDKPYHLHCCRNCGEDVLFTKDGQEVLSNYRAFCGAEMRGEEDDR